MSLLGLPTPVPGLYAKNNLNDKVASRGGVSAAAAGSLTDESHTGREADGRTDGDRAGRADRKHQRSDGSRKSRALRHSTTEWWLGDVVLKSARAPEKTEHSKKVRFQTIVSMKKHP